LYTLYISLWLKEYKILQIFSGQGSDRRRGGQSLWNPKDEFISEDDLTYTPKFPTEFIVKF
jgi:hypothetical protein